MNASVVNLFADRLIRAGHSSGDGIRWQAFVRRQDVIDALAKRGFVLVEDGADHDPTKRRFFAAEVKS